MTFLEPVCKSGVLLREIAGRLVVGLEEKIPELQKRVTHILQKQLFGRAITELPFLLSADAVWVQIRQFRFTVRDVEKRVVAQYPIQRPGAWSSMNLLCTKMAAPLTAMRFMRCYARRGSPIPEANDCAVRWSRFGQPVCAQALCQQRRSRSGFFHASGTTGGCGGNQSLLRICQKSRNSNA